MAEGLLFSVATEILLKLGSYPIQQIALARGAKDEMKKLEKTMTTITNVILDAEEKQVTDRAVKEWMQRLKDLVYEIDELLDEFATEALIRQVEGGAINKIKNLKVFNSYNIGRKTKNMRKKLDEVVADMKVFNFIVKAGERPFEFRRREDTSSFVRVPEVIGRDRDKEDLIKNLIHANSQDLLVLPIVGMGGLGKTTLAQLVFNDKRIVRHFTQRIWVCVSDNFNINTIIANILKAAGDNEVNEKFELEILQARLRQKLSFGKIFLVLDDVWNEDRVKWGQLRDLLIVDGRKSAVLVTTRSRVVALIMGTIHSYDIRGLSDEDCLCVLGKWAFNEGGFERRGDLVKIGEEIVKKCGGVPLAARSLGCLLYMKTDERDWCRVRDNEIWTFVQNENDVLPILKLSYDQLPHSLKNCFAYLSIFQKDEVIHKWKLIYMWSAQGFIRPSNSNEELEVTGERFLNELVLRSFLDKHDDEFEDDCYRMHDLFHDLALYVAGNEFFCLRSGVKFIPDGVRHVSIAKEFHSTPKDAHPIKSLLQGKKMRTILVGGDNFELTKIFTYKQLRVFHPNRADMELFSLIFKGSKHLRYLDLNGQSYRNKVFITRLVNLQYLSLRLFYPYNLPKIFGNLVSLRYLSIYSEGLKNLPEEEIVRLISLRVLIVDMPYLKSLPEGIYRLTFLRVLEINNCDRLKSLPLGLRLLGSLEHLSLIWCKDLEISNDDLQGLKSLKSLKLEVIYRLLSLPEGLYTDTAASLEYMKIRFCARMEWMSLNFANFTSLKKLEIIHCHKLSCLPQGLESLTTLQSVSIQHCPRLRSRCREGGEDWAKISRVPHFVTNWL